MRMRAVFAVAVALAAGASALVPAAANAACAAPSCASTQVTFGLAGGALSITAPATVDFSSAPYTPGGTGSLTYSPTWPSGSPIQVSDLRLVSLGWTDTMGALSTWTGTGGNTMSTLTSTFGLSCTNTGLTTLTTPALPLSTGGVLATAVAPGNHRATCTGNLSIVVPPTAKADTYTGTITQTVA